MTSPVHIDQDDWTPIAVDALAMERYRPMADPADNAAQWAICQQDADRDLAVLLPLIRKWLADDLDRAAAGSALMDSTADLVPGLQVAARILRDPASEGWSRSS